MDEANGENSVQDVPMEDGMLLLETFKLCHLVDFFPYRPAKTKVQNRETLSYIFGLK